MKNMLRAAIDKLFPRKSPMLQSYFKMLDGYTPIFTSFDGGCYEMELTRACIHSFASHVSKLAPAVQGADPYNMSMLMRTGRLNEFQTISQFLYKTATIYEAKNTVIIAPVFDEFDRTVGFYPVNYSTAELLDNNGEPWIRFTFADGTTAAVELARVGVVNKFLYKKDIFGESNGALSPTLALLDLQRQGIREGIKNGASFRFMATYNNFSFDEDLAKERERFSAKNLSADNSGGLILFPNTYSNIQQISSTPKLVDAEQMDLIQKRTFLYFGTNEEVLMNKAYGDAWTAYYEGKIEPFAIQLSEAMSSMIYTPLERKRGNAIVWTANRLQYMSNADKLAVSSQMFDRGLFSTNEILDIWNLPHVEGGDVRYIRKEYTTTTEAALPQGEKNDTEKQNQI